MRRNRISQRDPQYPTLLQASQPGHTHAQEDVTSLVSALAGKASTSHNHDSSYQATLVSGTNIKTVNGNSVLGSGNLTVSGGGYSLCGGGASVSPSDGTFLYVGNAVAMAPGTTAGRKYFVVPKAGTVSAATFSIYASATIGTSENISVYLRHNNTTDYLVETIGDATLIRSFRNPSLNFAVSVGDWLEFKIACPTWSVNPTALITSCVIVVT